VLCILDKFNNRKKYKYYNISFYAFLLDMKTSYNIYVKILKINTYRCIITFASNKYTLFMNKNIDMRERP